MAHCLDPGMRANLARVRSVVNIHLKRAPAELRCRFQGDLGDEPLWLGNAAVEALAAQHIDLDLRHVEPELRCFWGVMGLQPVPQVVRFARAKGSIERAGRRLDRLSSTPWSVRPAGSAHRRARAYTERRSAVRRSVTFDLRQNSWSVRAVSRGAVRRHPIDPHTAPLASLAPDAGKFS
jgi:hypothetical protein